MGFYGSIQARSQIVDEMIKYADKELLYQINEMQTYLQYILLALTSLKDHKFQDPISVSEEIAMIFLSDSYKCLIEIYKTHKMKILLDIMVELLELQNISKQFDENHTVNINEELVSDIYGVLISAFNSVLKITPLKLETKDGEIELNILTVHSRINK